MKKYENGGYWADMIGATGTFRKRDVGFGGRFRAWWMLESLENIDEGEESGSSIATV
jgi:hypothetical protein